MSQQSALVSFSTPVDTGGSPIVSYTVTANPGGITSTGNISPILVTGLSSGVSYTFTVTATNSVGVSLPSVNSPVIGFEIDPYYVNVSTLLHNHVVTDVAGIATFVQGLIDGTSKVTSVGITTTPSRITTSGSPITSAGNITLDLATTGVTAGNYTNANVSVDSYGRVVSASNGSAGSGGGSVNSGAIPVNNFGFGTSALSTITTGVENTALGISALTSTNSGTGNTAVGYRAMQSNVNGINNVAVGSNTLLANNSGSDNSAIGNYALSSNTSGSYNVALGHLSLQFNTTGSDNVAIGGQSMQSNTTGGLNIAIGTNSLKNNIDSTNNVAIGPYALTNNTSGPNNVAVGYQALGGNTTGLRNTAIGFNAGWLINYTNCTNIGSNTATTGHNQVQLGDSNTTTYVYGTVQNRSDLRDKADVRDTVLGLEFINALRPVDYKWDMREDYKSEMPEKLKLIDTATPEEIKANDSAYKDTVAAYSEANKLANITTDGSKKRSRYHHGFIAQEVKALIETTGVDFGGFQDHSATGGEAVMSIGYDEMIAPLIKAVQELSLKVLDLETRLSNK